MNTWCSRCGRYSNTIPSLSCVLRFEKSVRLVGWLVGCAVQSMNRTEGFDPCSVNGAPGACVTETACGVQASMLASRPQWRRFRSDGSRVSLVVDGLEQEEEYLFSVVMRPTNDSQRYHPFYQAAYTSTTGTATHRKGAQRFSPARVVFL